LQQFLLIRVGVTQQSNFFEKFVGKEVGLVNQEKRGPAMSVSFKQQLVKGR
jgi:hypothetical protein